MEAKEQIIEDLKRLIIKTDSSINLMVNGRFIPAYEKVKGIRHILCNMIASLQSEHKEEETTCISEEQNESAEMQ